MLAFLFRFISVLFSQGYGMSDDHFLIIEVAQSWVDGFDQNNWLPGPHNPNAVPSGHSLFYTGLHYYLFVFLKMLGITDPTFKMYIVRLLHALYSLITVKFGYKIAEKLSGKENAKTVGLLLAVLWLFPMLSVRNLVEMVCIPPLMYATWLLINALEKNKMHTFLVAGLIAGLAFSIRFQTSTFIAGLGLVILFNKKIVPAIIFGMGIIISIVALQGGIDMIIWGRPFAEFGEYTRYNIENANNYITGNWYNYLLLLTGILIPPFSLFILFGYARNWRKMLIIFLPAFLFLLFHSSFPNKQERFILPIVPFIIISGVCGWNDFVGSSVYWQKHPVLLKNCMLFFWILNSIVLIFITPSSTKLSRVDAMVYLSKKDDAACFILETSNSTSSLLMPRFYLQRWTKNYEVTKNYPVDSLAKDLAQDSIAPMPQYIIFGEAENIDTRVATAKKYFPGMTFEATIEPSFLDKIMHWLNPFGNENQTYFIYKAGSLKAVTGKR